MSRDIIGPPPDVTDPYRVARGEIAASIDGQGRPTGDYWQIMGMHAARQTKAVESIRLVVLCFAALYVVGAALLLIFYLAAAS
jgi:hypothetical protein